jgi:type IV secretion system protein VirB9
MIALKSLPLFLLVGSVAMAAELPARSADDPHVQSVVYNPDQVVVIKTRVGVATLIQFDKREWIDPSSLVGMGDAEAWKLSAKRSNILFKPVAARPDTNLTVVTDKRTYLFRLESAKGTQPATYILRFSYPEEQGSAGTGQSAPCASGKQNYNYVKWGSAELAPSAAWDDGTFTCFRFPKNTDLPEVFRKMPDGTEMLVNTHMQDDVLVVHDLSSEYRLRLGNQVLGVKTTSLTPAPYNRKGTTTNKQRKLRDV